MNSGDLKASAYVKTYIEQIGKFGLGTPLWRPDPYYAGTKKIKANIGDVGFIDPNNGSWKRFFNICDKNPQIPGTTFELPKDGMNSYPNQVQTPVLYRLQFQNRKFDFQLNASPLYVIDCFRLQGTNLTSIRSSDAWIAGQASYRYENITQDGAVLMLQSDGYEHKCGPEIEIALKKHIAKYAMDWFEWIRQNKNPDIKFDAIQVIAGWTRARDWYLTAFPHKICKSIQFSLSGTFIFGGLHAGATSSKSKIVSPLRRHSKTFRCRDSDPIVPQNDARLPEDSIFIKTFGFGTPKEILGKRQGSVKGSQKNSETQSYLGARNDSQAPHGSGGRGLQFWKTGRGDEPHDAEERRAEDSGTEQELEHEGEQEDEVEFQDEENQVSCFISYQLPEIK